MTTSSIPQPIHGLSGATDFEVTVRDRNLNLSFKSALVVLAAFVLTAVSTLATPIKNIVLVHGEWVDGSG
jgi:hypothetical protein